MQVTPALDAGGVERTTVDVAAAIVADGGRALVATSGGRMEAELAARGGELLRLPVHARDPLALWRNAAALRSIASREGASLIHARSRAPAWSALRAAQAAGAPFVTTYAGRYNARSPAKRLYNSVMARGDLVIANSAFTRDHLLAEHPRTDPARVVSIPRGVDLARFDPEAVDAERIAAARGAMGIAPDERRAVVLLAGRLTRWKGQALMIEALVRARSEALLVLAGDAQGRDGYLDELTRLAATHGVADRVRVAGHLADMPAAYLAVDLAVAPSLEPEAFGRTAVEPQAMRRPVLAADHGAPRETVEEGVTGWRVAPGDPAAWAAALDQALALA
ncbi:MAG: glycosyltransferase family 4 protein, partial [Caulobacteraceae bacterium]|nr:glycosyltransferase family 4 protein [Caulobacter sp.]